MDLSIYPRSTFGPSGSGLRFGLLPRGLGIALGAYGGLGEWAFELIYQLKLGWSVWASLGRTKTASGLSCRMLDRPRHVDLLLVLKMAFLYKNKKEWGSARALPVAAPMHKSVSF